MRDKLHKFMKETLYYEDLPGLSVGISIGENSKNRYKGLDFKHAVGFKDFITKEPLEEEHIFHMASVTKIFVGTAIMQLEEAGKIRLEDRLSDLLPWFFVEDQRYLDIRVKDLLTHTSGFGDVKDYGWDRPETDNGALRRYVQSEEVEKSNLLWSPGAARFQYSNMAYEIIGAIIAEVSGQSFEDYVRVHIFEPLEMRDTTLLTFERAGGSLKLEDLSKVGVAMPHRKDGDNHIIKEDFYPYNRAHGPSSTLTSNLNDMEKWAKAHLNTSLLNPSTYERIWEALASVPNNGEHVGLSWFIRKQNGFTLYGHEGNDDGFRASFWICPELEMHIVVTANISKAPVKKINKSVFDILTLV